MISLIEKFNEERFITAIHYDGVSKSYYVKRFIVETTTLARKFNFISEDRGSKLIQISYSKYPILQFSYRTKRGEKKIKVTAKMVKESLDGILEDQDLSRYIL